MAALTFDTRKFDRKLKKGIAKSKKKLDKIFDEFYKAVARIGAATGFNDEQKEFKLSDHPQAEKAIEKALGSVVGQVTSDIEEGVTDAWDTSNAKNNALMTTLAAVAPMPSNLRKKATKASMSALAAFQQRKVNGMNLSQRVWKTQENVIPQIELALELGLAEGKSAAALSRDVRQNLKDPQRLFRRVRDKYGVLRLSKAAKACHPGQGVYRSSYKNALRLTATETNMAYRSADHAQEQQMPFVLGIEIHTSDNHPVEDICDELKGVYPKEFKFTGWHPFCRCFTTTKLPTREELSKWAQMTDEDRAKYHFTGEVRDMPKQFTDWMENNAERLENAKNKPYFITDNFKDGDITKGLRFETGKGEQNATPQKDDIAAKGKQNQKAQKLKETQEASRKPVQYTGKSTLDKFNDEVQKQGVKYLKVNEAPTGRTEAEIIQYVSGGDMTEIGSCSPLAFAYVGNKAGLDVLDYRGGKSLEIFAARKTIKEITKQVGGEIISDNDDFRAVMKLSSEIKEGKEYYLSTGSHAAIVRRQGMDIYYLELQSPDERFNGWHILDIPKLNTRFLAQQRKVGDNWESCLIDTDNLKKNAGFRRMLGFINTEASKQIKGKEGRIR